MSKSRISINGPRFGVTDSWLARAAKEVLSDYWKLPLLPPPDYAVEINIVDSERIRIINREYLSKKGETDVIAFSYLEGEASVRPEDRIIGELFISKDAARKQAKFYEHRLKDEIEMLIVHGLLHVAGWDEGPDLKKCQENIIRTLQQQ